MCNAAAQRAANMAKRQRPSVRQEEKEAAAATPLHAEAGAGRRGQAGRRAGEPAARMLPLPAHCIAQHHAGSKRAGRCCIAPARGSEGRGEAPPAPGVPPAKAESA